MFVLCGLCFLLVLWFPSARRSLAGTWIPLQRKFRIEESSSCWVWDVSEDPFHNQVHWETQDTSSGAFGERGSRSCYRFQLGWRQAHPVLPSTVRCHLRGSQPWSLPPETRPQLPSNSYPSQPPMSGHSQTALFPHSLRLHPASVTFEGIQIFSGGLWGSILLLHFRELWEHQ